MYFTIDLYIYLTLKSLAYRETMHCVQTAFVILTGQGSVLNIDPMTFYVHLYNVLFKVHAGKVTGISWEDDRV